MLNCKLLKLILYHMHRLYYESNRPPRPGSSPSWCQYSIHKAQITVMHGSPEPSYIVYCIQPIQENLPIVYYIQEYQNDSNCFEHRRVPTANLSIWPPPTSPYASGSEQPDPSFLLGQFKCSGTTRMCFTYVNLKVYVFHMWLFSHVKRICYHRDTYQVVLELHIC